MTRAPWRDRSTVVDLDDRPEAAAVEEGVETTSILDDGLIAGSFRDPSRNEDVDIRVLLAGRHRESLQDLLDVDVTTPAGYLVKLRDVADVELTHKKVTTQVRNFGEKALAINCNAGLFNVAPALGMGGTIDEERMSFDSSLRIEERVEAVQMWIEATAEEAAIIAR